MVGSAIGCMQIGKTDQNAVQADLGFSVITG